MPRMTPMMARVLSQALVMVIGGSSWVGGADLSPGSLPEHDESYLKSVFGPPADTDYDYYEAEVPNAMPQRVPDPLLRQNTSGPTRVPHNSSRPPNSSGAPQFGSNVPCT